MQSNRPGARFGSGNLKDSKIEKPAEFAAGAIGEDPQGYRTEFVDLVRRARGMQR